MQETQLRGSRISRSLTLVLGLILFGILLYLRYRPKAEEADRHPHHAQGQGGVLLALGDDRYHVEAVVLADGTVELLALGRDESRVVDVEGQTLTAYVKAEEEATATKIELAPAPQRGDAPGRTSRWSGQLPTRLHGRRVAITIPVIRFDRERFRVAFATGRPSGHDSMPRGVGEVELTELYLTPAGRYSEADINANGRTVPSEQYQGFRARHDFNPRPGDTLCPVSRTKANPECTWIIGGETYQFCCPPCIDEFVKLAKEHPEEIRPPGTYKQ